MDDDKLVTIKKSIAWRRILIFFVVLSLAIGVLVTVPVFKHEIDAREIERIKRVQAEGLIPCDQSFGLGPAAESELLTHLPERPSLSITANPSFYDIESVHLVGRDLYYVRREHPALEFPKRPMKSRTPKVLKVSSVRLSDPASSELIELVQSEISYAAAEWPMGLDGTTYYFETPTGCAAAWSPDSSTRAGKMVNLFWTLSARANSDGLSNGKPDDANLRKVIKALRSEY